MSGFMVIGAVDFDKLPPAKYVSAHDLPCGCCVDVTEERGGHWWRFVLLDRDFLCVKAKRLKGQDRLNHFRLEYAREKEGQR